jgi:hypothetical protein
LLEGNRIAGVVFPDLLDRMDGVPGQDKAVVFERVFPNIVVAGVVHFGSSR